MSGKLQTLPTKALPTSTVTIEGTAVEVRGLSRSEALKLSTQFTTDIDGAESFIVACGTGVTPEEAQEWRNTTDPETAGLIIDEVILLSGLSEQGGKTPQA